MKLKLHRFDLPLRHPFTISRGTVTVRHALVVELEDAGCRGFGEATDNAYYKVTVEGLAARLESARSQIEATRWETPAELWEALRPVLGSMPFAQCALDVAAHDLWGKKHRKPAFALWGLQPPFPNLPVTDYTIALDTVEMMVRKMQEVPHWPAYKIKLGTTDDVAIVKALRQHTAAPFYLDANCAWSESQALALLPQFVELGVTFVEQPLPAEAHAAMGRLKAASPLPLIADESCQNESDIAACAEAFHGINIKIVKCGGLTPARRMIAQARARGLKVMLGCMTESTVGISGIAQLLPLADYADLDGPLLIAHDIATGVRIVDGHILYAEEAGCGVKLSQE